MSVYNLYIVVSASNGISSSVARFEYETYANWAYDALMKKGIPGRYVQVLKLYESTAVVQPAAQAEEKPSIIGPTLVHPPE